MRFRRTHSHSPTLSPRVGTGIGLALVKEFVRQHGGSVRVESTVGKGSMFVVTIPTTADHLPKDRVASGSQVAADAIAAPYLLEASHWDLPKRSAQGVDTVDGSSGASSALNNAPGARILIADDNADMREYLVRLLAPRWTVDVVEDGQAALEAALQHPPDLVLSDVMMPRMDGVALLQSLRADPRTNTIPILLLSARAGEEAVVGGLETGADDYLVKPFSARELITRVGTHLQMARVRRAASEAARELAETRAALLADLERKNDGLEAFSHSVSHDLRAPLRRIDGFSQMLLKDHAERLDAQGRDYPQRMRVAAQRNGRADR